MKSNSTERPSALEPIGKGKWHYNYHIEETEATEKRSASFDYECVEVQGTPTYDKCVTAVIRASYPADAEMALMNKYNAYQQGVSDDASVVEEYAGYLRFVSETKAMVHKDLDVQQEVTQGAAYPRMADVERLLVMQINTMGLTDDESLTVQSLYPTFSDLLAKAEPLPVDFKFQYDGKLYKVLQEHTPQEGWLPGTDGTKAIYGLVSGSTGEHAGTLEDPIPYERNMVLYEGKYYTQFGEVYLCTRNSIVGYDVDLADPGLASLLEKVE